MKLADVRLSFPHVAYDVMVSHHASRQATAVEWVILEAIQASTLDSSFKNAPFSAVFEDILSIKDADRLIKPVIFDLVGSGMILVEGLSDEAPLGKMTMSQFALTEKGRKLRKDGFLPGRTMEDVIHIFYDVFEETCKENKEKNLIPEATGIKAIEAESADDIVFPSATILDYLESPRGRSNNQWLTNGTQILDLTASKAKLSWKNISRRFEVGKNLSCYFEGIDNPPLFAKALDQLDFPFDESQASAGVVNPDKELNWIDSPKKLALCSKGLLASSKVAIIRADSFADLTSTVAKDALRGKVLCVPSSSSFLSRIVDGTLVIEVQDDLLPKEIVSLFAEETLHIGNFSLQAGGATRKATLLFSTPPAEEEIEAICETIATRYTGKSLLAALPLLVFGKDKLFQQLTLDALANMEGLSKKSAAINDINHAAKALFRSECISKETAQAVVADELKQVFGECSFDDIAERVARIKGECTSKDDARVLNEAIRVGISALPEPSGVKQVWALWSSLEELGINVNSLDSDVVTSLYSERCMSEIESVFSSPDFYSMPAYTIVERSMLQLRRSCDRVSSLLGDADLYKPLSEEDARLLCIANKGSLEQAYTELKSWQEKQDDLSYAGVDPEKAARPDSPYAKAAASMKSVRAGIGPFYDESSLKYSAAYVVDTCALMNSPELVETFEDNRALLIVPSIVLSELDGLKSSDDEDRAFKARDAIRAIDNHRAFEWLNLRENSHPELLGDDYDKDRNDCKILSIAIKYIFKQAVLITDDANLRNLAQANAIEAIGSVEFLEAKRESRMKKKRPKQKRRKR